MKTKYLMLFAATALLAVACRKDELEPDTTDGAVQQDALTLSCEDQTIDASGQANAMIEGNDSTFIGSVGAADLHKSLATFQPASLIRRCPVWINGDREFGGHGPVTQAYVQLFISAGTKVRAHVYYRVKESTSNWSEAIFNEYITLYTAPAGHTIAHINTDAYTGFNYTDTSHGLYYALFGSNESAWRFIMNGDTEGNDIGNCTTDDAYLTVNFNPVQVTLN